MPAAETAAYQAFMMIFRFPDFFATAEYAEKISETKDTKIICIFLEYPTGSQATTYLAHDSSKLSSVAGIRARKK